MSILEVAYGGATYRIAGRSMQEVQLHIAVALASGHPGWLEAYDGFGTRTPYELLITPGVPIAICVLSEE